MVLSLGRLIIDLISRAFFAILILDKLRESSTETSLNSPFKSTRIAPASFATCSIPETLKLL